MSHSWRVRTGSSQVEVQAEGWLEALAIGLPQLGAGQGALARLVCEEDEHGDAVARDPRTGALVRVERITEDALCPEEFVVPAELAELAELAPPAGLSDDLLEDLFLRLGEISSATEVAQASAIALRIALDLVPAGAGATLIRTRAGNGLRFRAASGPAASKLIDTVIPLDRGIAGYVCQLGVGLSIADVRRDRRHDTRVDRSTGFDTRTLLAVPVRPDTGGVYGCIELLNPPRPFTDADLEVAARVGASLGTFLNSVYTVR